MTTNDIDAIRKDASRLVQLLGRTGDHPAAVAFRANDLASVQVPALCDEIGQLRTQLAGRDQNIRERYEQIARLERHIAGLEKQCNEQMHQLRAEAAQ